MVGIMAQVHISLALVKHHQQRPSQVTGQMYVHILRDAKLTPKSVDDEVAD
jgi:hypothetical protein